MFNKLLNNNNLVFSLSRNIYDYNVDYSISECLKVKTIQNFNIEKSEVLYCVAIKIALGELVVRQADIKIAT